LSFASWTESPGYFSCSSAHCHSCVSRFAEASRMSEPLSPEERWKPLRNLRLGSGKRPRRGLQERFPDRGEGILLPLPEGERHDHRAATAARPSSGATTQGRRSQWRHAETVPEHFNENRDTLSLESWRISKQRESDDRFSASGRVRLASQMPPREAGFLFLDEKGVRNRGAGRD